MIKLHKINLAIFISIVLLAAAVNPGQAVLAATDPDGRIIVEDDSPLNTSKKTQDNFLVVAVVLAAIVILGSVAYMNRSKLFKHKKRSRKK